MKFLFKGKESSNRFTGGSMSSLERYVELKRQIQGIQFTPQESAALCSLIQQRVYEKLPPFTQTNLSAKASVSLEKCRREMLSGYFGDYGAVAVDHLADAVEAILSILVSRQQEKA